MQKTGTVAELLHQIGPCAETGIKDQIRQRCKEIKPSATNAEIDELLETPIPMGTTLYIYATGSAPGTLVCNASRPPSYSGAQPDGVPDNNCKKEYDVIDTLVDTDQAGRGFGDLNLHGQPYMRKRGGPLIGKDLVEWTSSSGYGNLLGRLELSNAVSGQVRFKKPN